MRRSAWLVLLIVACLWLCPGQSNGFSWNIFSSSSSSSGAANDHRPPMMELDGAVADFSMDGTNNPRGVKLLENARNKLAGPKNCWQEAYRKLFASCGEIMADKERQSRLAWHLSSCCQDDSGRPSFPSCAGGSKMVHCRKKLTDSENKVFLEFFQDGAAPREGGSGPRGTGRRRGPARRGRSQRGRRGPGGVVGERGPVEPAGRGRGVLVVRRRQGASWLVAGWNQLAPSSSIWSASGAGLPPPSLQF